MTEQSPFMSPKAIAAMVLRQFYLLRGSPVRVIPLFAWVAVDIVLWGFISKYIGTLAEPGFNAVSVFLGAILLWDFFGRVMQGVTTAFFEDVWSRNFLNLFASPMSIPDYVCGLVLISIATSTLALLVMLGLASAFFGLNFLLWGLGIVPFVLILFLFGIALGIFGCAVVLRFGPASEWLIWPIPSLLSPFVGVFYPLSTLPDWLRAVSLLLPPAYVFEALREVVAGQTPPWGALGLGGLLALGYIVLAGWYFATVYRHALKTGLIARYSAESLS